MLNLKNTALPSSNNVISEGGLIIITLAGKQDAAVSEQTYTKFVSALVEAKAKHHKGFVLVDIRNLVLSDLSTQSRLKMKDALEQTFGGMAVVGDNHFLQIAMYLIKGSSSHKRVRYFVSESKARKWLRNIQHPKPDSHQLTNSLLITLIGLTGVWSLLSWLNSSLLLTRVAPSLGVINPISAIGIVAVAIGLYAVQHKKDVLSTGLGAVTMLLGVAALLPSDIDYLLFANKVHAAGPHADISISAALCFICAGVYFTLRNQNTPRWHQLKFVATTVMLSIALFNLFGLLYAPDFLYSIRVSFAMPVSLALAFMLTGGALLYSWLNEKKQSTFGDVSKIGWLVVIVLIFMQIATFSLWEQSIGRNKATSEVAFKARSEDIRMAVQSRIQAYIDAQSGFRGLFASSVSVNQAQFNNYYQTINLQSNYPGLLALTFISRVEDKDLPQFIAERQRDNSLGTGANATFKIINKADSPTHYIVTYYPNGLDYTSLGTDIAGNAPRRHAFERAEVKDAPTASGTVTFPKTATRASSQGFFITMPVHSQNAVGKPVTDFVNAVFSYQGFFTGVIGTSEILKGVDLSIVDENDSTGVFQQQLSRLDANALTNIVHVRVVDRSWKLTLKAAPTYGITTNQKTLPASILLSGQFLSLLLVIIFILQGRSRNRALELANVITADLQLERNNAVAEQRKNQAILAGIGEGLLVFNHNGEVDLVNAAAKRLLGRTDEELIGKHFDKVVIAQTEDGTELSNDERPLSQVLHHNKTISTTFYYVKKNGERFPVQLNVAPVIHNGKTIGAIEVFRDITREKEVDKAKTEFVSLASHQLRTPLSTINWYSEMLLAGDAGKITDEQTRYIDEIYRGNQRMVDLVGALLNASRIDLGTFSVDPEPTNLIELCKTIVKDLEPRIFARKMDFQERYDKSLPIVNVDPKLMRMVIENLAANSVKYTPEKGKIVLSLEQKGGNVLIAVKDNGYGIPKKQQEKIFSKLFRADNVKAQDTEGTGLGLYIVKSIVDYSGGKIWFESVENKGTTFFVSLPIHGMKQKKGSKQLD